METSIAAGAMAAIAKGDGSMTTKQEHTPLPWRIAGGHSGQAGYIASEHDGYVPINTPFREEAHTNKSGGATPQALANARFIVQACNAHADLLAAVQATLVHIEELEYARGPHAQGGTRSNRNVDCARQLRTAIAKATGPQT